MARIVEHLCLRSWKHDTGRHGMPRRRGTTKRSGCWRRGGPSWRSPRCWPSCALGGRTGGALQRLRPKALGDQRRRNGRAATLLRRCAVRLVRAGTDAARGRWGVERPQGGRLDGAASRLGAGASAARLGSAAADRLVIEAPRPRHARAATPAEQGPLKGGRSGGRAGQGGTSWPSRRGLGRGRAPPRPEADPARVWARVGQRPIASATIGTVAARGRLRQPTSGETVWYSRPACRSRSSRPARRLRAADRRGPEAPHHPGARQCRLAWPRRFGRPRGDQPGVPAALHSGAAAGRASLAAGRRGGGQHALRHAGCAPCHRRRTLPPTSTPAPSAAHRFPLVAEADEAVLISRSCMTPRPRPPGGNRRGGAVRALPPGAGAQIPGGA